VNAPAHAINWLVGWWLVLAAFATGAAIGLFFHRPDFLGGYDAFRRRILRLGHIALAALGMLNVIYAISPWPAAGLAAANGASIGFIVGGIAMPAVCFLTAWREGFRHLFFIPVVALMFAVVCTLMGGVS
jgi:small-conductance mechanosensitive channel